MDVLDENINSNNSMMGNTGKKKGFVEHVFYLSDNSKYELFNLLQYVLLALIPIVILNKLVQKYIPEVDYNKESYQVAIECILQIVILFVGMFFIHRIITFIPTYSGRDYSGFNLLASSLSFLLIVLGLQTKLGEKVELLYYRLLDLWNGTVSDPQDKQQPTQRQEHNQPSIPRHQTSRADDLGNSNLPQNTTPLPPTIATHSDDTSNTPNILPPGTQQPQIPQHSNNVNFDTMYQEPMASNEGFSGFSGSVW